MPEEHQHSKVVVKCIFFAVGHDYCGLSQDCQVRSNTRLRMLSTRLDPVGTGAHPSVVESDDQSEVQEIDILNPGSMTLNTTKTAQAEEYNAGSENEKGQQDGNEKPRPVGFWHHDLVNVRLHVIKLWARTGK